MGELACKTPLQKLVFGVHSPVDTRDASAVEQFVRRCYLELVPGGDPGFVREIFRAATDCFEGRYPGYQSVDARYHDFEHTLQGTLCMTRLLVGRQRSHATPILERRHVELGLIGILLHDTGYLKRLGDDEGTGAKYTLTHVQRSCEFAGSFLQERDVSPVEISAVQHMISCTGVNVDLRSIPFASEETRLAGFALGTADLLGQMAAPDYVDKLPILYLEFEESARFNNGKRASVGMFESADDLMRKTPEFWEKYVWPKLENDFGGLHRFLNDPWPAGPNPYLGRIEQNIRLLKNRFGCGTRIN